MDKKKVCSGKKIGVILLIISFVLLPFHSNLSFAADPVVSEPSIERQNGPTPETMEPAETTMPEREQAARMGDAGPGATKDLKSKKWWWIGGGLVAIGAIIAAAGGGGGGGGSTASH